MTEKRKINDKEEFVSLLHGLTEKFGDYPVVNGKYKDRVFRMIFKEKKEFLELYNAMNQTHYTNPEDLIVTTLENAIYMSMKNDVSYLVYDNLALYEHQSTYNPNMPLRDLFYVAHTYSGLTKHRRLYSTRMLKIPEPVFVVFYNGKQEMPERKVMKLSDMYITDSKDPALELKTVMLNINPGYNEALMNQCKTLREYSMFVTKVRELEKEMPYGQAVERAVDECIRDGILSDFLLKNKSEVIAVSIFEYNEEEDRRMDREEARQCGLQEGIKRGISQGISQGLIKSICGFLADLGPVSGERLKKIEAQKDISKLEKWNKLAANAISIDHFFESIKE